jgi:hypothetical protein
MIMMTKRPWTLHVRRALTSPGNLLAGAGALLVSAATWNPLPLILYGLGEPVWLYAATTSGRYARDVVGDRRSAARDASRRALATSEQQLAAVLIATPCGHWVMRGHLPDYATGYARLTAMRDQAEHIALQRHDAANVLELDIVARMDDMLRGYLLMARERLLFHCSLAKIYPQLEPAAAPPPSLLDRIKRALIAPDDSVPAVPPAWAGDTRFVSPADAEHEIRDKLTGFALEIDRNPAHDEVYRPLIDGLERRLAELAVRSKHDLAMAAQLKVLPDQMDIILNKLATTQADVSEVIADVKLLLEQTDDAVRFAQDTRDVERHTLVSN